MNSHPSRHSKVSVLHRVCSHACQRWFAAPPHSKAVGLIVRLKRLDPAIALGRYPTMSVGGPTKLHTDRGQASLSQNQNLCCRLGGHGIGDRLANKCWLICRMPLAHRFAFQHLLTNRRWRALRRWLAVACARKRLDRLWPVALENQSRCYHSYRALKLRSRWTLHGRPT